MSEFEKWWRDTVQDQDLNGAFPNPPTMTQAQAVWNGAINAVVEALKSREKHFRSGFEKNAVLLDVMRLKVEGGE